MGLVIPPDVVLLARDALDDPDVSVRELILAHWVLSARLR